MHVIKVPTLSAAAALRTAVVFTAGDAVYPFGAAMLSDTDLLVGIIRSTPNGTSFGFLLVYPTPAPAIGYFSSTLLNQRASALLPYSSTSFVCDYKELNSAILGFALIDTLTYSVTYYTQSLYFNAAATMAGIGVDSSLNLHLLFLTNTQTLMLSKANGSTTTTAISINISSGTLMLNANAVFDGSQFFIVSQGTQYNGTPTGGTQSAFISSSNKDCDCMNPNQNAYPSATLTTSTDLLTTGHTSSIIEYSDTLSSYTLTFNKPANDLTYNDQMPNLECGRVEFIVPCLLDYVLVAGDPNFSINIAACVKFNG